MTLVSQCLYGERGLAYYTRRHNVCLRDPMPRQSSSQPFPTLTFMSPICRTPSSSCLHASPPARATQHLNEVLALSAVFSDRKRFRHDIVPDGQGKPLSALVHTASD